MLKDAKVSVWFHRTNATKAEAIKKLPKLEAELAKAEEVLTEARLAAKRSRRFAPQAEKRARDRAKDAVAEMRKAVLKDEPAMGHMYMPRIEGIDVHLKVAEFKQREREQRAVPSLLGRYARKSYWWFQDKVYLTDDPDLTPEDVDALVNEQANARRLRLEKAHALKAMTERLDSRARRQPIPQDVKVLVWQRDGGRCVECNSNENLEYDHIIPLAMGGSNTDRNLQLLCGDCNRRKGASLG